MSGLAPWHQEPWRRTVAMRRQDRLPHALLLRGPPGVGKHEFARYLSRSLVCESLGEDLAPCGGCRGCHLHRVGNHPDCLTLAPAEPGKGIVIEQIRDLIAYATLTRQYGRAKVVTIHPAEAMNRHSANTLLKILEEPPAQTLFLLISHLSELLPATIRSRCQILGFPVPPRRQAREWLEKELDDESARHAELLLAANGAPYRAIDAHRRSVLEARAEVRRELHGLATGEGDPIAVAGRWKRDVGAPLLSDLTLAYIFSLARLKLAPNRVEEVDANSLDCMRELTELFDFKALYSIVDRIIVARRALVARTTVNELLLLEGMAIAWTPYHARPVTPTGDRAGGV